METLKLGSKGDNVRLLQQHLNLIPDGIYGKLTEETVRHQQSSHGLTPDGICGPKTWDIILAHSSASCAECRKPLSYGNITLKRTTRKITRLIVHCTATPEGKHFTVDNVRKWHKQQGWSDIGYHYLIYLDGTIAEGRDINLVGAHTTGYNTGSIGICYVGGLAATVPDDSSLGKSKDTRTDAQKKSLRALLAQLKAMYGNPTIYGHRNFAKKDCPSFNAYEEYKKL
ncbi:MAG: N-acetylmuramoyl-L-alanine amidase [Prevotellaceae bacterium]|nr:N-acetylmuramoyl-L-alanine amidase [Prevotellaceae bacterium]